MKLAKIPLATLALLVSATLLVGADAVAQDTPDWNRRVLSFDVIPPDAGEPSWTARAELSVTGFTAAADGADGSLTLQYLVNDEVVGEQAFGLAIATPGNCNCTDGCNYPDGWCDNSQFGCWCGIVVRPETHYYTTRNLSPGDVASVRIVAADGSVAEQYLADDVVSVLVEEPVSTDATTWSGLRGMYR